MKLFLLATYVATVCYVNAGKKQRTMAAMNGGMMAGVNGGMANGAIPGMTAGGLSPPIVAGGGAGFFGQPQFAQFVPGVPAFAVPPPVPNVFNVPPVPNVFNVPPVPNVFNVPPIPNVFNVPAANVLPFMGVPQMAPMNPPQQPLMAMTGGAAMQQQLPVQPDPFRRFRRQIMKQDNTLKTTVDTQIPAPTETTTTTPCDEEGHHEDY